MASPPKGLIIALVTPLDAGGGIDWPSLERLIARVLPHADGLLVGEGLAGEGLLLSDPLRFDLLRGVRDLVAGKKPLLLCPTSSTPENTLHLIEAAQETGPKSGPLFWVDLPLWYHSNRKLPQFYGDWAGRTSFPILLYNHPHLISRLNRSLKRTNIRTAVLKRLAENDQIIGLIQTGDLERTIHYQRAVRARREFRFYDGQEADFLNQPSSSGVVSWGANLLPQEWKEIVSASLDPAEDPARSMQIWNASRKLKELTRILGPQPAGPIKYALQRLGVIDQARTASLDLPSAKADEVAAFLSEHLSWQST